MALPAILLERLPEALKFSVFPANYSQDGDGSAAPSPCFTLALGLPELEEALPDGGIPGGAVTELAVRGGSSLATSITLAACASAHALSSVGWCAFVDPTGTLHGPGVERAGVSLERLLVVRPKLEALSRVALRVVESNAFVVVVIDLAGTPGARIAPSLGAWSRVVRRLSLAALRTRSSVILVTDASAHRPLPLPVALRVELARPSEGKLSVAIPKDRRGRISSPRSIAWVRNREAGAEACRTLRRRARIS